MAILEVRNIEKCFGNVQVLKNIDFLLKKESIYNYRFIRKREDNLITLSWL